VATETIDLSQYVTCPLSEGEVQFLEAKMQKPIPLGFRGFLLKVGVPQNLVPHMIQDEDALVFNQRYHDAHGIVFAEPAESFLVETASGEIIELAYEESRAAYASFEDFLEDNISPPHDPSEMGWAVQLSFATSDEARVLQTLEDHLGTVYEGTWERLDISPAGVTSFQMACLAPAHPHLKRLEYSGWTTPIYFLDQRVSPPQIADLKTPIAAWRSLDLGFKLVNYGIMPMELDDE
jgi:hypothetical protein